MIDPLLIIDLGTFFFYLSTRLDWTHVFFRPIHGVSIVFICHLQGGQYILNLIDYFCGTFIIVILASFEVIAISWIYGIKLCFIVIVLSSFFYGYRYRCYRRDYENNEFLKGYVVVPSFYIRKIRSFRYRQFHRRHWIYVRYQAIILLEILLGHFDAYIFARHPNIFSD